MSDPLISPLHAAILGIVEGLTEYLPVSSTGHLILTAKALGLDLKHPAVDAFMIVIQGGAILAVLSLYFPSVLLMLKGLAGRSAEGLRLTGLLLTAFIPAAIAGKTAGSEIKERLFNPASVAAALAAGGAAMILIRPRKSGPAGEGSASGFSPAMLTFRMALAIGLAQCLALWPGTSRSMVTMMAALLAGLSPRAAAEFSFLLALPTLGAATAHDLLKHGGELMNAAGTSGLAIGLGVSWVVAAASIKVLVGWLTRHGFALFGWYRLGLAAAVFLLW